MVSARMNDVYSPDEIARAAGVPEDAVVAAIGSPDALVSLAEAVRIGRTLFSGVRSTSGRTSAATVLSASRPPLFAMFEIPGNRSRSKSVPLVVSSTVHVTALVAALAIATFGLTPKAATLPSESRAAEPMRLVFVATPGPGGGGGGGGLLRKAPPPKAEREGRQK